MFKKFLAGGVLVPWPGTEPVTLQWKAESEPLDHQGSLCWFLSYTPAMKLSEKMTKNIQIHENEWDYLLYSHWGEKDHLRRNHESKCCFVPIFDEYNTEQPPSLFTLVGRCQSNRSHMRYCREPAREIPPMTRSCGETWRARWVRSQGVLCLSIYPKTKICLLSAILYSSDITGGYPQPPFSGKS